MLKGNGTKEKNYLLKESLIKPLVQHALMWIKATFVLTHCCLFYTMKIYSKATEV